MKTFLVTADNAFNEGWLRFVLGLPKPDDAVAADGWEMGRETGLPLSGMRFVMERQRELERPQYVVEEAD